MKGHLRLRGRVWYLILDRGPDPVTGKRRQRTIRLGIFPSRKEAEKAQITEMAKIIQGDWVEPSKQTLKQFLARWMEVYVKPSLALNTARTYDSLIKTHVLPVIGARRLHLLNATDLIEVYELAQQNGAAPASVRLVHAIVGRALKDAVRWGFLLRNPADNVDAPKAEKKEMQALTREEVSQLVAALDETYGPIVYTAVMTGLREGELLALRWSDVHFDRGTIRVHRTIGSKGTKTPKSRREVQVGASVLSVLQAHKERQLAHARFVGPGYVVGLVFATKLGTPMSAFVVRKAFYRTLERAGLRQVRFHDLRHTHATLLLAMGEHPLKVSRRLGHSSIAITMDRYSHVTPEMDQNMAQRLDDYLDAGREMQQ